MRTLFILSLMYPTIHSFMISRLIFGRSGGNLGRSVTFPHIQTRCFSSLERPTVLYEDNHLLAINKPAGWHSVPNPGPESPKCLLSELKRMGLGGGSNKDFLLSLHRIDQPCTGILLFAKTGKAATRVSTLWKKKKVQKQYLCVVSTDGIATLRKRSTSTSRDWHLLEGCMSTPTKNRSSTKKRSVSIRPADSRQPASSSSSSSEREVSIEWKLLKARHKSPEYQVILVKTSEGARHMVRAMLAQVGRCPIAGDVRYNSGSAPLPDKSVALHAFRVALDPTLQLGSLDTFSFQAPLPKTWVQFFGIDDTNLKFA